MAIIKGKILSGRLLHREYRQIAMDREDFSYIRGLLEKTQSQMAGLLGISFRGVENFEQGLRRIPVHRERQMLFLLASLNNIDKKNKPCWTIRKCAHETINFE